MTRILPFTLVLLFTQGASSSPDGTWSIEWVSINDELTIETSVDAEGRYSSKETTPKNLVATCDGQLRPNHIELLKVLLNPIIANYPSPIPEEVLTWSRRLFPSNQYELQVDWTSQSGPQSIRLSTSDHSFNELLKVYRAELQLILAMSDITDGSRVSCGGPPKESSTGFMWNPNAPGFLED